MWRAELWFEGYKAFLGVSGDVVLCVYPLETWLMRKMVRVTRNRQTTIPARARKKLEKEGDEWTVETVNHKIDFKLAPRIEKFAGILREQRMQPN